MGLRRKEWCIQFQGGEPPFTPRIIPCFIVSTTIWGEPSLVRLQTYWTVVDTMRQNRAPITAPHLILGHANIHLC